MPRKSRSRLASKIATDHGSAVTLPSIATMSGPRKTPRTSKDERHEAGAAHIASLTSKIPLASSKTQKTLPPTKKPFCFLCLPSELRISIYRHVFNDMDAILDLGPDNHKRIHKLLGLMRICKQIYTEATHFFYSTRSFRIFPTTPGRYFKAKKPLLARLQTKQRRFITSLELRLGPGWNAPPRGWVVNDALGLHDCIHVRRLDVFVECDPSDGTFRGFRQSDGFYENFSCNLLTQVIEALPALQVVQFDAWPSVKKSGAMMRSLLNVAAQTQQLIRWGPQRGWTDAEEDTMCTSSTGHFHTSMSVQGCAPNIIVAA